MSTIGQRIKFGRLKKGLSQEALAEKLKVEGGTVSRWESGKYEPNPEIVPRLLSILDITLDSEPEIDIEEIIERKIKAALGNESSDFKGFIHASGERVSYDEIYNALRDMTPKIRDSFLGAIVPRVGDIQRSSASPREVSAKQKRRS